LKTAEEKQRIANIIIMHATQKKYVAILKRALSWMGVDAGYCRSPFSNLNKAEEEVVKNEFRILKDKHGIKGVDFLDAL
jgi:N-acetylneuraminate lyase